MSFCLLSKTANLVFLLNSLIRLAMKYIISLDWFQYFCHAPLDLNIQEGTYYQGKVAGKDGKCPLYKVCPAEEFHAIYRRSYTIKLEGYPICHVHYRPKSSALDPHSCAVKVANRLLYSSTWSWHLHNVCSALSLDIKSITRVDLCCDFVRFANGQFPSEFIHMYLRNSGSKDTFTYVRRGSNKFCAIGKKLMKDAQGKTKISDTTEIKSIESCFDYLRFGTRQSGCSVYLYNKSLELKEKHGKPWIRRSWVDAGLIKDTYRDNEVEPDVYRLELSIQAKGMTIRELKMAGENFTQADIVRKLVASDFATQLSLESTFWAYQARYFSFKVAAGQKYRKDMKELQLFEPEIAPNIKPVFLNREAESGVAERNASKCIIRLQQKADLLSTSDKQILIQASEILAKAGVVKYYDHLNDFSWTLDPVKERMASERQKSQLDKMLERRMGHIIECFTDPEVAEAVERWESTQAYIREIAPVLKEDGAQGLTARAMTQDSACRICDDYILSNEIYGNMPDFDQLNT